MALTSMAIGVKGNGLGVLKDLVRTDIKFVACDRVHGFCRENTRRGGDDGGSTKF